MQRVLELVPVGDELGVILPPALLARLAVGIGDSLQADETPDGLRLTPCDPDGANKLKVARDIMRKRRDALGDMAD